MRIELKNILEQLKKDGLYTIHSTSKFEDIPCLHMRACLMVDALRKIYGGNKNILKVLFDQVNIDLKYGISIFKHAVAYRHLVEFYNQHKNSFRLNRSYNVRQ